jgi:putative flippase GtrA
MSLTRQTRHYLMIGGVQWLVDWGVMVALSHFGMLIEAANVVGRITFSGDEHALGRRALQRFILMWLCTTVASTWAMGSIDDWFGLKWAWLAKPGVELLLGVVGFVMSRHWVYRK